MLNVLMFPIGSPGPEPTTMNYAIVNYGFVIIISIIYWSLPGIGVRIWFDGPKNSYTQDVSSVVNSVQEDWISASVSKKALH